MSDRDSAIIKIGFEADVKDFVKNIKRELASVKDFGVGDALKEEINEIEAMLDGLSKSFSDAMGSKLDNKTFASFEKKINADVQEIDKRVTNLEDSMQALVTTMDSADSGKMTSFLQDVGSKMQLLNGFTDETVKAIRELVNIVSKSGGSVKFADNSSIESLEKEKKILQEISEGLLQVKTSGLLKSETGALRQISNAYDNLREARKKLSEVKDVGNNLEIAEAERDVVQLTQTIREFQEQSKGRNYKKHPFTEELIKELVEAEGEVKVITSKIEDRLLQIGKSAKNLGKSSAASMSKEQSEIKIPIIPDITKEDFWPKVRGIIEYTQKSVDKNPVEIGFVLSSKMSTKNTNKLLKEWQEKVATIDDDQLRGEFESLYDQLAKDVNKGIHINVDSNLKKESDNIRDGVSELQKMLGNKVKVYPQFTISERQTKKLQTELNKASKSLTLTINNFELKEKGKNELSKNIEEVSALRDVVDNLNSKLENMGDTPLSSIYDSLTKIFDIVTRLETPIHEIANSIKYLGTGLRAVTDFTPSVDLDGMFSSMAESISTIHGKLGKVKGGENPLVTQLKQIVVAYKEYQKLGGEKSLVDLGGDANVQNWLKKHANDDFSGIVSNIVEQYIGKIKESIPQVQHASEELVETPKEVVEQEQPETSRVAEALAEKFGDTLSDAFLNQKDKVKKALKSLLLDSSLSLVDLSSDKSMFSALSDEVYSEWVEAINTKAKLESKGKLKAKILSPEEEEERKGRWAESLSELGLNSKYARLDFKELKNLTDISKMKSYYQQLTELVSKLNIELKSDRGSTDLKEFVSKINDVIAYFDNQIKETEKANSTIKKRTRGKSNYQKLTAKDLEEDSVLSASTWEAYRHLKKQDKKDLFLQIASMFKEYQNNSDEEVLKAIKQLVDESDFSKSLKTKFNDELAKATKNQKDDIAKASDQLVSEYAEGMESAKPEAKKAGENVGEAAIEGVKEVTDTHSPSRVTEKLGEYFGEGYAKGILNTRAKVKNAIRALVEEGILELKDLQKDTENGKATTDALSEIANGKKLTSGAKGYQKQIQDADKAVQNFLGSIELFKGGELYKGIDNVENKIFELVLQIKLGTKDVKTALEELTESSNFNKVTTEVDSLKQELKSLGLGEGILGFDKILGTDNIDQLKSYYSLLKNYNDRIIDIAKSGKGSDAFYGYATRVQQTLDEVTSRIEKATPIVKTLKEELKSFGLKDVNFAAIVTAEDSKELEKYEQGLTAHLVKLREIAKENKVSDNFTKYINDISKAIDVVHGKLVAIKNENVADEAIGEINKVNDELSSFKQELKSLGLGEGTLDFDKILGTDNIDQLKVYYSLLKDYNSKIADIAMSGKGSDAFFDYATKAQQTLDEVISKLENSGYKQVEGQWTKVIDNINSKLEETSEKVEKVVNVLSTDKLGKFLEKAGLGSRTVNLDKMLQTDSLEQQKKYYEILLDYNEKLNKYIASRQRNPKEAREYESQISGTLNQLQEKIKAQGYTYGESGWVKILEDVAVESKNAESKVESLNDELKRLGLGEKTITFDKILDTDSPESLIGYYRGLETYFEKAQKIINQGEGSDDFLRYVEKIGSVLDEVRSKLFDQGWTLYGNTWRNGLEGIETETQGVNDNLSTTLKILSDSTKNTDAFATSVKEVEDEFKAISSYRNIPDIFATRAAYNDGLKTAISDKTYNGKNYFELPNAKNPNEIWQEITSGADKAYRSVRLVGDEISNISNVDFSKVGKGLISFTGALKTQVGDASSDFNTYVKTLEKVIDTKVTNTLVKKGDELVPTTIEETMINYQKLEEELIKADTKIIELSHRIANATEEEANPLRENLDILKEQRSIYQEILDYVVDEDFYKYDQSSLAGFNQRRYQNRTVVENNLKTSDIRANNLELEKQKLLCAQINTKVTELEKIMAQLQRSGLPTEGVDKLLSSLSEVKDKNGLAIWNEELKQFKNELSLVIPQTDAWAERLKKIDAQQIKTWDADFKESLAGLLNQNPSGVNWKKLNGGAGEWTGELAKDLIEINSRYDVLIQKHNELVAAGKEVNKQTQLFQKNPDVYADSLQEAKDLVSAIIDEIRYLEKEDFTSSLTDNQIQNLANLKKAYESVLQTAAADANNAIEAQEKYIQQVRDNLYKANQKSLGQAETNYNILNNKNFQKSFIPELQDEIDELRLKLKGLLDLGESGGIIPTAELKEAIKNVRRLKTEVVDTNKYFAESEKVSALYSKIAGFMDNNTAMARKFKTELKNIMAVLKSGGQITESEFRRLETSFNNVSGRVKELGQTGNSLFRDLAKQLKSANARFLTMYFSWYDWIRYARQAYTAINELDYALVDLKKTTTMTSSELNEFYYDANEQAKKLGVTTKEIIDQAAAWSRLGYSSQEAATEMAALSSQFAQISPGMSVDTATDGLVSTMKAFHVDVADVESEIMDIINKTGNTMATTNEEIVNMLERSSAAMSAANNTIKETIALESAAVQITRNAETTGTAFRTISMRIRGYDEETEEYIGDIEELTGKIADLTKTAKTPGGISLFTDATKETYKSTYQILKDISEIYNDLSDKNQAELLETLAGKRGGQVLAGILEDFSEVERAMNNMEEAAGSADAEMKIVEESLAFKMNNLKQTWIGIIQEVLNKGLIGKALDFLTKFSEILGVIVKKLGIIGTAGIIGSGFALFKNWGKITNYVSEIIALQKGLAKLEGVSISSGQAIRTYLIKNLTDLKTIKMVGWVAGITAALVIGKMAWDHYNTTIEEVESSIRDINDEINELSTQIKELENIESRTSEQEARLGLLKDELEVQKELLEVQERRKALESITSENDSWTKKLTDWFDDDNYSTYLEKYQRSHTVKNADWNEELIASSSLRENKKKYDELNEKQRQYNQILKDAKKGTDEWNNASDGLVKTQEKLDSVENDILKKYGEEYSVYIEMTEKLEDIRHIKEGLDKDDPLQDYYDAVEEQYISQLDMIRSYLVDVRELLGKDTSSLTLETRFKEANSKIAGEDTFNNGISGSYGTFSNQHDLDVIAHYTKDFSNEQKEAWIVATQGAKNATEAIQKYEASLEEAIKTSKELAISSPILDSVESINTRLKPQFDELANAYESIFSGDNGFDLSKVDNSLLKGISDNFVSTAVENELLSEEEATIAAEKFMKVLTDQSTTADEARQAFNDLATSYFYAADGLKELDSENADAIKQQLKQMGVTNADVVVDAYIDYKINANAFQNLKEDVAEQMRQLEDGGDVDLLMRPVIDASLIGGQVGEIATVASETFSNEAGDVAINVTPILPDGSVLSSNQLEEYANMILDGVDSEDIPPIQIGAKFTGEDAIKQAVDAAIKIHELQDAYYNFDSILLDVTEDTAAETEARLEAVGAVNAHALVTDSLNAKLEAEALQSEAVEAATSDMAGETSNASEKFVQEAEMSNLAKVQLANLVAVQTVFNNQGLAVDDKIQALGALANAYLGAAAQASFLNKVSNTAAGGHGTISPELAWQQVMEEYSMLNFEGIKFEAPGSSNTAGASEAGKEAADAYVEAYEKEKEKLERDRDLGLISERQYLDKLKTLVDKFFKDRAQYAERYMDEMKSYMDALLSHYNSVISGVTTLIGRRITALQKEKDAAITALQEEQEAAEAAYQAQIDAYQAEIDALQETIDAIQEKIDAIDEEIEAIDEKIEKLDEENEKLQDQIDAIEEQSDAIEKQKEGIQELIDALDDETEVLDESIKKKQKEQKVFQDQIDAINDANAARERSINLQKAEYELNRMQNQRTKLVYTGAQGQMRYEADQSGIRDAQNNLQKAQDDMKLAALQKEVDLIQKLIDKIEEQKEKIEEQKKSYNDQIELLEKQQKALSKQTEELQAQQKEIQKQQKEYQKQEKELQKQQKELQKEQKVYQKQQEAIQKKQEEVRKQMEATTASYEKLIKEQTKLFDDMIAKLEETKAKWEELAEIEAVAQAWGLVADEMAELGYTVDDVLNDTPGAFEAFKREYINAIAEMHSGDENFLRGIQTIYGVQVPGEVQKSTTAIDSSKAAIEGATGALDVLGTKAEGAYSIIDTKADTAAGKVMTLGTKVDETTSSLEGMDAVELVGLSATLQNVVSDLEKINGVQFDDLIVKLGLVDQAVGVEKFEKMAEALKAVEEVVLTTLADELGRIKVATEDPTPTNMSTMKTALEGIGMVNITQLVTDFTTLQGLMPTLVEALSGVDGASGLVAALQQMQEITLEEGIIAQFEALKESVVGVTNALDGSGGESSSEKTEGGEGEGKKGEAEGGGTLADALDNIKTVADETIGVDPEETEDTVIGHFNALGTSIEKVTKEKIGLDGEETEGALLSAIEDAKEVADKNIGTSADATDQTVIGDFNQLGDAVEEVAKDKIGVMNGGNNAGTDTLVGTLVGLHNAAEEHIPEVTSQFGSLKEKIDECIERVIKLISLLGDVHLPSFGGTPAFTFTGTALATGTAISHQQGSANYTGDWRVGKNEKSLVGELGPEIVLRNGKYTIVGEHGPEFYNLKKDDVVLNHLQSKEVLSKKNKIGPSHAEGTLPDGFFRLSDDSAFDKLKAVIKDAGMPTLNGIKGIIQAQTNAIKSEIKNIASSNSSTTTVNQHNTFNIQGVSGEDVARQINTTLVNTFSGMSINAYQRSMA